MFLFLVKHILRTHHTENSLAVVLDIPHYFHFCIIVCHKVGASFSDSKIQFVTIVIEVPDFIGPSFPGKGKLLLRQAYPDVVVIWSFVRIADVLTSVGSKDLIQILLLLSEDLIVRSFDRHDLVTKSGNSSSLIPLGEVRAILTDLHRIFFPIIH